LLERLPRMEKTEPEMFAEFMERFKVRDSTELREVVANIIRGRKTGMPNPPRNEAEFRRLFDRYAHLLGFRILHYTTTFPDYILQRGNDTIRAEAELLSGSFVQHGHNPERCDLIVCWEDTLNDTMGLDVLDFSRLSYRRANGEVSRIAIPGIDTLESVPDDFSI